MIIETGLKTVLPSSSRDKILAYLDIISLALCGTKAHRDTISLQRLKPKPRYRCLQLEASRCQLEDFFYDLLFSRIAFVTPLKQNLGDYINISRFSRIDLLRFCSDPPWASSTAFGMKVNLCISRVLAGVFPRFWLLCHNTFSPWSFLGFYLSGHSFCVS